MTEGSITHLTPANERERRYQALRAMMSESGLDALVVAGRGDGFFRGRIQYVSDIFQGTGWGYVVIPMEGHTSFVADPVWGTTREEYLGWVNDLRVTQSPGSEIGRLIVDLGYTSGVIGVVGLSDAMSLAHLRDLESSLPKATFEDATDLFDSVRAIKSQHEIDNLRETSRILRRVYRGLEAEIRSGVAERDVMAQAHRLARQFGCLEGIAQIARTPFTAFSYGTSGVLEYDDIIVIDLEWAGPSGYWLELIRCFSFRPPPPDVQSFWEARVEAFGACAEAMKPGTSSDEISRARDEVYVKHGLTAEGIKTYTAHGIGVDVTEPPWVPGKERILQENMVLAVHPEIRLDDPDEASALGKINVADNVLVTQQAGKRLTDDIDKWIVL